MVTRAEVEDFLFHEAALLDDWRLNEWLALWSEPGRYVIPATDCPDGDPASTLALVADDLAMLRTRVSQLVDGTSWAEVPRSRTRRLIGNVRVLEQRPPGLRVTSNFIVHRFRHDQAHTFVGRYDHELVSDNGAVWIREKHVVLSNDTLHPQGRISIIL